MNRNPRLWLPAVWLVLVTAGCDSCSGGTLATLTAYDGDVQRDFTHKRGQWAVAALGAEFSAGDAIQTSSASRAILAVAGGGELELGPDSVLRFEAKDDETGESSLSLSKGKLELSATGSAFSLASGSSTAKVKQGTKLTLSARGGLRVRSGSVELTRGNKSIKLGAGESQMVGSALDLASRPKDPKLEIIEEVKEPEGVAFVRIVSGSVKIRTPGGDWTSEAKGKPVPIQQGTRIRVSAGASADVNRGAERSKLTPGTYVLVPDAAHLLRIETGSAVVQAKEAPVSVLVPAGEVLTPLGSVAVVEVNKKQMARVGVRKGEARVKHQGGEATLRIGEKASFSRKGRIVEGGTAPAVATFAVRVGESFTVFDRTADTVIGFQFAGKCAQGGVVERLRKGRVAATSGGQGRANLMFPPGTSQYRLRCASDDGISDEVAAQGTVTVRRDAGRPEQGGGTSRPQFVDANGMNYKMLYDGEFPPVTVRWKNPPVASRYTLKVRGATQRTINLKEPKYTFKPDTLPEGKHFVQFLVPGSKEQSRITTLRWEYQSTAPTSGLLQPNDRSFAPGSPVTISGVALGGTKVSVGATEVSVRGNRFRTTTTAPFGMSGIAVRLADSRGKVQYYVRRAK